MGIVAEAGRGDADPHRNGYERSQGDADSDSGRGRRRLGRDSCAVDSVPEPPVGPVEYEGDLWLPADVGHLLRVDPRTEDVTYVGLDPTRYSEKVGLAGHGVSLWVTGADDRSVGLFDTTKLDVTVRSRQTPRT